jgi:D-3-phosphoglycerate dehydrogenase
MRQRVLNVYPEARLWDGPKITDENVLTKFLAGCDAALIGFEPLTERVLAALPKLRIVSKFGAGYDNIDFEALHRHGVRFGYEFGVNRLAVAELTVAFMVAALRWVMPLNLAMRAGARPGHGNGRLLTGRVVGIHGCGNVGKEVVRLLAPFRCEILACDIRDYPEFYRAHAVEPVPFDELIERAEIISVHLPLTEFTRGLYVRDVLARLRADCVLVNTSRGGIVDEDALLERLESGALVAAAFDVFAIEPAQNDGLLAHPNLLSTPHIGASTEETRVAMIEAAIRGLTSHVEVDPARFA